MLLLTSIQTVAGDRDRRWISDDYFDLVLWYEADPEQVYGFQLCYGKPIDERALTWTRERGFSHQAIDTGEASPMSNRTPVLTAASTFPAGQVRAEFEARSASLPEELRHFILHKLDEYCSTAGPAPSC